MNYQELLKIKYKYHKIFLIIVVLLIGSILFLSNKKINNVYNTYGYVNQQNLILKIPIKYADVLNKMDYLKVDDEKIETELINISEILFDEDTMTNYQEVVFKASSNWHENQLLEVNIYFNKEKVITKLKNLFL